MKTERLTLELPDILERELNLIPETGLYDTKEEFVVEAIKTLLAARKDVRLSIACKLYENGETSLGGACRIADVDIETMKAELHHRGIERLTDIEEEDIEEMALRSIHFAGRDR